MIEHSWTPAERRGRRLPRARVFENASSLTRGMAVGRYGDWNATVLPSATLADVRAPSTLIVEDQSGRFGGGRDRIVVAASSRNRARGERRLNQLGGWRSRAVVDGGDALRLMSYRSLAR